MYRISQDEQGKAGHMEAFNIKLKMGMEIVVDRMNFDKKQRDRYIKPAKEAGYEIEIVVFHVPRAVCFERIMARENHPTINGLKYYDGVPKTGTATSQEELATQLKEVVDEARKQKEIEANSALDTFFTKYERVEDTEADKVTRLGWVTDTGKTKPAVICDLDGTLCDLTHRLHYVKNENKKLNRWDLFEKEVGKDGIFDWCKKLVNQMGSNYPIIFCSGRNENAKKDTKDWLLKHGFEFTYGKDNSERGKHYQHLFMRNRNDFRQDYIIKEIILEFEIKTRYTILFSIDDRKQVVDMWRKHGIVCLQCAEGNF